MIPSTLVEAHLAGTLTAAELRLLEESLRLDPPSTRSLVQAARLETALEAHFAPLGARAPSTTWLSAITATPAGSNSSSGSPVPPAPIPAVSPGNRRQWWIRRALAAAALLMGAAAVHLQLRSPSGSGADQALRPAPPLRFEEVAAPRPGNSARSPSSARTPQQEAEALAFRQRLAHYGLTDLRLDRPQSIAAAVDHILSRAKALNHLNRPEITAITFRMPEDPALEKRITATTLSLPFQTMALMEAVEWYAASAQCRVACPEAGVLTFVRWTGEDGRPPDDRELVTRDYQVRAGDLEQTPGLTDPQSLDTVMEPLLRTWGVPMGPGASVTYHPDSGALRATLTEAAHRTLEQKLPNIGGKTGPTVFLTTKLIQLVSDFPLENQLLDDGGFQMLMRAMSQRKGVDLMTAPSAIARSGVEAEVEIFASSGNVPSPGSETDGDSVPGGTADSPAGAEPAPGADSAPPAIRITLLPWVEGEVTKLSGTMDIVAGSHHSPIAVDFAGTIPDRHTAFFSINENSDDSRVFAAVTVIQIDPQGQPLSAPSQEEEEEGKSP